MAVYAAPEAGTSSYGLRVACFETIPVPTAEQLSSRAQLFTASGSASSLTGPTLYPTAADIRRISGMNAGPQDSFRPLPSANEISQHGLPVPNPHPSTSVSPSMQAMRITAAHPSSPNEFLSTNVATYPKSLRASSHRPESPGSPRDNARFSTSDRPQFVDQPVSQSSSFDQVSHGMRTISSPSSDGMGLLGFSIPPRGSHGEPSPVLHHQTTYGRAFPPGDPMQNPTYPLGMNPMTGATLGAPPSQQTAPYQRVMDPHQFSPGQAQA